MFLNKDHSPADFNRQWFLEDLINLKMEKI
jgi:hypothetical protein